MIFIINMINLISKLLKEALNELELTNKFKTISYPNRVEKSWLNKEALSEINKIHLPSEIKNEIFKRIKVLETLTFDINGGLSLLIYQSNKTVYYDNYPENPLDNGVNLYVVIRGDLADTIYWKELNKKPSNTEYRISYEDLLDYVNGKKIGTKANPITSNTIKTIENIKKQGNLVKNTPQNEFKMDGKIMVADKDKFILYFKNNPSKTIEISDDILEKLPQNIQDYLFS